MAEEFEFHHVDKFRLDEELEEHPKVYRKFGELLAMAREDYEFAKTDLRLVTAELDLAIRSNPAKYGLDSSSRLMEKAVEHTVITQKAWKQANRKCIEAKTKVDTLEVAVTTLEHRKRVIEKLVDLYLSSYFARPKQGTFDKRQTHLSER